MTVGMEVMKMIVVHAWLQSSSSPPNFSATAKPPATTLLMRLLPSALGVNLDSSVVTLINWEPNPNVSTGDFLC